MIWWKMDWHTKSITSFKLVVSETFQEDAGKSQPAIQYCEKWKRHVSQKMENGILI